MNKLRQRLKICSFRVLRISASSRTEIVGREERVWRDGRGWLVKDRHAGSKMDRAGNRQRLALASRQTADEAVSIVDTICPKTAHRLDGDFIGALAIQALERPPTFLWLFADEERASDTHQWERPPKLVDGRNAMVAAIARAVEDDA